MFVSVCAGMTLTGDLPQCSLVGRVVCACGRDPDRRLASVQSGRQGCVGVSRYDPDRRLASVLSGRQGRVCLCVCVRA